VYVASTRPEGRVNALDRNTGQRIWRVNVGLVSAPLALVDRTLLVANQRGELLGLDPKNGARHWRRQTGPAFIAPIPVDSGEVVLATPDSLFRIATGDGAVRRRVRAPGAVVSPWIRMRGALVAGTADSLVLAVDPDSLLVRWKVRLDAPVMDSPAIMGDTVYAATRRGTLYRVIPGTPAKAERIVELDWPITAPVTIVHRQILLGGADGTIRALDLNGSERWRINLYRPIELGPLPLDDGMVAVGGRGDLHRFRR
jgi:outer membrane protein assembly factor BamB